MEKKKKNGRGNNGTNNPENFLILYAWDEKLGKDWELEFLEEILQITKRLDIRIDFHLDSVNRDALLELTWNSTPPQDFWEKSGVGVISFCNAFAQSTKLLKRMPDGHFDEILLESEEVVVL